MSLPIDLQILLPEALDVIRYLGTQAEGAWIETIMADTGLSERLCRKAIRRLVTRYYADMPQQDFYRLTTKGQQAAQDLIVFDGVDPASVVSIAGTYHTRRLAVVVPKELVIQSSATIKAGFDAPADGQVPLREPGRVILRISAPGCNVEPVERPIEVQAQRPAGPVRFALTPRREGTVRIKIEVYQLVTQAELIMIGGTYFDLKVAGFPTPDSAEFQALGASVGLIPGADS
jgi:hypothetical protein